VFNLYNLVQITLIITNYADAHDGKNIKKLFISNSNKTNGFLSIWLCEIKVPIHAQTQEFHKSILSKIPEQTSNPFMKTLSQYNCKKAQTIIHFI
jgi:hypothetical protein